MIILRTNVISEIFRPLPEPCPVDWLASLEGDVAITSVTLAELLAGVRSLPDVRRRDELTRRIDAALAPYRGGRAVLPFDDVAAARYADALEARGAPERRSVPPTRNAQDLPHTGVDLVNPWTMDA